MLFHWRALDAAEPSPTSLPTQTPATNWPFLRGANFDGHSPEKNLAETWPEQGPPVLWTRTLGQGYSGFVAWDERVATQYQTLGGQFVACLAADTGKTLWQYRYDWPYEAAGVYPGPRATPTYYREHLYFAAPNGLIGCLRAANGQLVWSKNVNEQFGFSGTEFGYSCSPTLIDGMVILPVGGSGASLVALDAADGSTLWQAGSEPASYTSAYPISFRGQPLVLGYLENALTCHDRQTGELLWNWQLSAGYDEHSAWPIYREPYLWISSPFQSGSELLELTGDAEAPLRRVWKSDLMSNDIFSSVLHEGALYGFDLREAQAKTHRPSRGQFRCLDFLTGEQHWATGDPNPRRGADSAGKDDVGTRIGHATVIVADEKLYLMNDTGELIMARAIATHYEELGRVSVLGGEICWTQPILSRGRLFVRNHSRAVCVYVGEPENLAPQTRASALTAADIPQSEYVDVAAVLLGVEPEYAFDIPSTEWLWRWFLVSLVGIMGGSLLVAIIAKGAFGSKLSWEATWWICWTLAIVLGAIGTTLLSRWTGDFIFTWPVVIFVAFQALVAEVRFDSGPVNAAAWHRWRGRLLAVLFLACCVGYFLLCRRLSLVFEWVFLCGFAAALPFSLAGTLVFRERRWRFAWQALMTCAAFASFYWSAVMVLWLKSGVWWDDLG